MIYLRSKWLIDNNYLIMTSEKYFDVFSLVVIRGHSWSALEVTRVYTFRHNRHKRKRNASVH